MRIIVVFFSLIGILLPMPAFPASKPAYALDKSNKSKHISESATLKNIDSCTERCHVNYMAYENDYELPKGAKIFRHKTHSMKQNLDCSACHKEIEVNTEGHGKLTIEQKDCLKCHHITPDLDCIKCHENDINRSFNTDPQRGESLSWTIFFDHSQHPEQNLSCKECHLISRENDVGIVGYDLNCSKCHHVTEEVMDCVKCHKEPSAYFRGEIEVEEINPVPDMMSRAVKCEDCHKYDEKGLKFKEVKEYCMECHNNNYGKLYDAWRNMIRSKVRKFNYHLLRLCEEYRFPYTDRSNMKESEDEKRVLQSDLDTFLEKTSKLIHLITKYGMHNFNLTRLLMDYVKDKTNDTIMHLDKQISLANDLQSYEDIVLIKENDRRTH